jgi:hypothetical protein
VGTPVIHLQTIAEQSTGLIELPVDVRRCCRKEVDAQRKYGPRTRKGKDTRRPWFEANYGRTCCELDALNPNELRRRVEQAILAQIDVPAWNHMQAIEEVECNSLRDVMTRWRESISGPATK